MPKILRRWFKSALGIGIPVDKFIAEWRQKNLFWSRSFVSDLHCTEFYDLEINIPHSAYTYVKMSLPCVVQNEETKVTQSSLQKFCLVEGALMCQNSFAAAYPLPFELGLYLALA